MFSFVKSQTRDSFDNHFDGHFAYLKTLDFSFKFFVALFVRFLPTFFYPKRVCINILYPFDVFLSFVVSEIHVHV